MFSGFLLFMVVFDWRWVWILVGLVVAMVMDLCGWLWLGGYGNFLFFRVCGVAMLWWWWWFFVFLILWYFNSGDGWLLVVGLSFSGRCCWCW